MGGGIVMPMKLDTLDMNNIVTVEDLLKYLIEITESLNFIFDKIIPKINELGSRHIFNSLINYFNAEKSTSVAEIANKLFPGTNFSKLPESILELPVPYIQNMDIPGTIALKEGKVPTPTLQQFINRPDVNIILELNSYDLHTKDETRNPFEQTAEKIIRFIDSLSMPSDDKALADFFCYNFLIKFFPLLVQHIKTNLEIISFYYLLHDRVSNLLTQAATGVNNWDKFKNNFEKLQNKFVVLKNPPGFSRICENIISSLQALNNNQPPGEFDNFLSQIQMGLTGIEASVDALHVNVPKFLLLFSNNEPWSKLTGNKELIQKILELTVAEQICSRKDIQNLEIILETIGKYIMPLITSLTLKKVKKKVSAQLPSINSDSLLSRKKDIFCNHHQKLYSIILKSNALFEEFYSIFNPMLLVLRNVTSFTLSKALKNYVYANELHLDFPEGRMLITKIRILGFLECFKSRIPGLDLNMSVEKLLALPVVFEGAISNNNNELLTLKELLELPDVLFFDSSSEKLINETITDLLDSIGLDIDHLSSSDSNFRILTQCYLLLINIFKFSLRLILSWDKKLQAIYNQFLEVASSKYLNSDFKDKHDELKSILNDNKQKVCKCTQELFPEAANSLIAKLFSSSGLLKNNKYDPKRELLMLLKQMSSWQEEARNADVSNNGLATAIKMSLSNLTKVLNELIWLGEEVDFNELCYYLQNPMKFLVTPEKKRSKRFSDSILSVFFPIKENINAVANQKKTEKIEILPSKQAPDKDYNLIKEGKMEEEEEKTKNENRFLQHTRSKSDSEI